MSGASETRSLPRLLLLTVLQLHRPPLLPPFLQLVFLPVQLDTSLCMSVVVHCTAVLFWQLQSKSKNVFIIVFLLCIISVKSYNPCNSTVLYIQLH